MSKRQDWYYWRIFAAGSSFVLFGLGGLILGYCVFPLVALLSRSEAQTHRRCRRLIQLSFRGFTGYITSMGVLTWECDNRELLQQPAQLIVANHPTLLDIVFLISMLPNACCIVKSDLYRNPFTRGPVSWAAYVANDSPAELVNDCVEELAQGASLVIFPEGTRSVKGRLGKFRRGAAYIYLEANRPLVLASIRAEPPTLSKADRWYQVPLRRPHITLSIHSPQDGRMTQDPQATLGSARKLTRQWRDFLIKEVKQ